jgi:hypothetical protein
MAAWRLYCHTGLCMPVYSLCVRACVRACMRETDGEDRQADSGIDTDKYPQTDSFPDTHGLEQSLRYFKLGRYAIVAEHDRGVCTRSYTHTHTHVHAHTHTHMLAQPMAEQVVQAPVVSNNGTTGTLQYVLVPLSVDDANGGGFPRSEWMRVDDAFNASLVCLRLCVCL